MALQAKAVDDAIYKSSAKRNILNFYNNLKCQSKKLN